jgi:membrane fusion protein (multidrug efflux system)
MSTQTPIPVAATPPSNGRRRLLLRLLLLAIIVAGLLWLAWYWLDGRWYQATDDAYVHGNIVEITPLVPGTVISIGADNDDLVHQGQVLVQFDAADARVALQRAEANLARAVRQVRGLYANAAAVRAELAARKVAVDKARSDFARRRNLAASGAISAEELANARDALAAAEQAYRAAQQQLAGSRALVADTVIASQPDVLAAAATVRQAYLDDVRSQLLAPVTGYVAKRSVQVGQRVAPGTPLMAVVPLGGVWVNANFKETQLTHMRIGQPVTLTASLYGSGVTYHGRVDGIGIGTGSAFALLPAQNATGNWISIVQRVPVRIVLEPKELAAHPLRIGLSMSVEVNLHDRSGPVLSTTTRTRPVLATDVYAHQLADADALVARIIHANAGSVR